MFDVAFTEVAIIGVVALIVVGPERLPGMARTAGMWVGRARRMMTDVKQDIKRELEENELGDVANIKTEFDKVSKNVKNAAGDLAKESGIDDAKSSLKESFQEASPIKGEVDAIAGAKSRGSSKKKTAKKKVAKKASKKKASKKKAAAVKKSTPSSDSV